MRYKKYFFVLIVILFVWLFAFGGYDKLFPRYIKVGMLSERLTSTPTLVRDMLKPGERIAKDYDKLDDKYYENEGGFIVRSRYYCSYNISNQIDTIIAITGVTSFKGNLELVSQNDFKKYLDQNQAYCIDVLPLSNEELYGDIQTALSWGLEAEGMQIYRKR